MSSEYDPKGGSFGGLRRTRSRPEFSHSMQSRKSCCSVHEPPPKWWKIEFSPIVSHIVGALVGLLAGLFLSLGSYIVKQVKTVGPLEINGLRSVFATVYVLILICVMRPKNQSINWKQGFEVFIVSIVFSIKFTTFVVGSTLLPLSNFSLLCNTVPLFTAILGCFCLSEVCGLREILSCLVVMGGVGVTFVPDIMNAGTKVLTESQAALQLRTNEGYVVTVLSALATAIALCWLRRLKEIHSLYLTVFATSITAGVCLSIAYGTGNFLVPNDLRDIGLIAFAGVCMLGQSLLPAVACSLTQASKVAVAMTFSVVFSFIIQSAQDKALPSIYSIVGGVLIMVAVLIGNAPTKDKESPELLKTGEYNESTQYGTSISQGVR